jgi:hypothetical protein
MKAPSSFFKVYILIHLTSCQTCQAYPERPDTSKFRTLAGLSLEGLRPRVRSSVMVLEPVSNHVSTMWGIVPRGGDSETFQIFPPTKRATARYANFMLWLMGLTSSASAIYAWDNVVRGSLAEWLTERHGYEPFTICISTLPS